MYALVLLLTLLVPLVSSNVQPHNSSFCSSGIVLHAAICLPDGYNKFELPREGKGEPVRGGLSVKIIDVLDVGTSDQVRYIFAGCT